MYKPVRGIRSDEENVGTGFQELEMGNLLGSDSMQKRKVRLQCSKSITVHNNKITSECQLVCVYCFLGIPECIGPVPQTGGRHPIGEILLSTVCSPCHYFRTGEHFRTGSTTGKWHPFPSLPALPSAVS